MDAEDPEPEPLPRALFYGLWPCFVVEDEEAEGADPAESVVGLAE